VKAPRTPARPPRREAPVPGTPAYRDRRLFERYRDPADPVDRDALVGRFLPLARQLAARFAGGREPYEDLLQVASVALLRAIDRFDPSRRVAFSSYATPTIAGEIKRHFRDRTWAVRVPRSLQERASAVDDAGEQLARRLHRPPTPEELAAAVQASEKQVIEALQATSAYVAYSLDCPLGDSEPDDPHFYEPAYDECGYERAEQRAQLDSLLAILTPREREVLRLRFEEDLVQREIGERIGVSQMQVSRIIRKAIRTLTRLADAEAQATDVRSRRRTPAAAGR
jgi:RNA polymerase sigma-B factor